ncbi:peroxisomal targeting signal 1 receptor isoform X2 [Sitophilus oryzae]|uniref:Peroxisomal targeting signal 1 receptor isoform X2 n=1 Tax=Sitophilus oryzae TaxID=7048 RepID=A0A6J2YDX3_SITOR|nr:peroxisomal targeting signal 1 receptor isoform X2 [Sitophilus oryzae]
MAFRALTEGECGDVNPLSKLSSHVTRDYAFSDNTSQVLPSTSDQLVEQFLQETRAMPQSFRMGDLMREMHEIESQRSALPPIPASTVKDQLHNDAWAQQYLQDGRIFHETNYEDIWNQISAHDQEHNFKLFENAWTAEALHLDNAAFREVQEDTKDINNQTEDNKFVYSKFMKFMQNVEEPSPININDGKLTEREAQAWTNEFLHNTETTAIDEIWANEFAKTENEEIKASSWDKLQEDFENVTSFDDNALNPWLEDFSSTYNIPQKEYEFSEENPMLNLPNPIEKGKELLESGDFPSAVLCFEAAVKQQPENPEAWLLLGTTQAENEQDPNAIAALNKCLQLDPTNLTALMSAAVSYTNESYYNQACSMLLNWLKHNPKYQDLVPKDLNLSRANQKLLQDLYLKAAQRNPQNIDYEVQCGLGVLCNLTGEYDKAADCFRSALSVRPDDARLWNRLGATLANGSKSEEAVEAYYHALHLVPGFIRARYNVGITCINLRAYKEAVEHFLTALNQQARGKDVLNSGAISQMSDTIWSTLTMCTSLMDRRDLTPLVKNKNLQELNKIFNID